MTDSAALARPPRHPRRLAFFGTPDDAVPSLRALHDAGFEIPIVVTQPDRRRGRGSKLIASPVKQAALELGLHVTSDVGDALDVDADLGVVVAFGRIIPTSVLEELAMVNLHFSLLPRWRGAAPVERAILAGDRHTGVCVMALAPALDTGDVFTSRMIELDDTSTASEVRSELASIGADLLVRTLSDGLEEPVPQVGEPVYAAKITPGDLELDFERPAAELQRVIRVGGAWTTLAGERFKIWAAVARPDRAASAPGSIDGLAVHTGDGMLDLVTVQAAGKPRMDAAAWSNGAQIDASTRLGS